MTPQLVTGNQAPSILVIVSLVLLHGGIMARGRHDGTGALMQFVVLAGGRGTRLKGAIPEGLPKPMAPVAGRPFLERLLDRAIDGGAHEVVLLVGHHSSAISDHFGSVYRGLPVRYSVETSPLGTGGALRNAVDSLAERFVLLNGDSYAEVDFRALVDHLDDGPLAMTLTRVVDAGRFGTVAVERGRAVRLVEKGTGGPGLVNAGIYACARELLAPLPRGLPSSFEVDVLEAWCRAAPRVRAGDRGVLRHRSSGGLCPGERSLRRHRCRQGPVTILGPADLACPSHVVLRRVAHVGPRGWPGT